MLQGSAEAPHLQNPDMPLAIAMNNVNYIIFLFMTIFHIARTHTVAIILQLAK